MAARTITQPANNSALDSSVVRAQLQLIEDEVADPSSIDPGHLHTVDAIDATGTPSATTFLRGDGAWAIPQAGTVTTVSVTSANGFAGTVTNPTTAPAITLRTTETGFLLGNGTSVTGISATGSGNVVRETSPTLVTPTLGVAIATSINGVTISPTTGVLTITSGKTFTCGNTLILTGTDSSSIDFGGGGSVAYINIGNTWADGVRQTFNPNGTNAGLNVGSNSGEPSSGVNGDLFYDSTTNTLKARIAGGWVILGTPTASGVNVTDGMTSVANVSEIDFSGATVTNMGGGIALVTIGASGGLQQETPSGTVNGSNTVFTVTHTPTMVLADGIMHPISASVNDFGGNAVTYSAGTVTFNTLTPPVQYVVTYYNA